ncbi:MAG: TolC family protein [Myxococcota bacterium]
MIALVAGAWALTLDEAVKRAAEVNPTAVVAELEWRRTRLEALEAWTALGVTPSLSIDRTLIGSAPEGETLSVTVGLLDPPAWFDAAEQSAQARSARYVTDATALDAQYAAALLYYEALAAESALDAAKTGEELAKATHDAAKARVGAGIESELLGRSAEIGLLQAQAARTRAEADVEITRARLSRALEQEIDSLQPTRALPMPTGDGRSPWQDAAAAETDAAKMEELEALAGLLPTASITARTPLQDPAWTVALNATWTFDGVVGPVLRARQSALDAKIAVVEEDALDKDLALALRAASENARAAARIAEAARAREALAEESLRVGQTRLGVGLASTLEVLRLQDEAVTARADRVAAELAEAAAVLEARRVGGVAF